MSSQEPLADGTEQSRLAENDSLGFSTAPTKNGDNHTNNNNNNTNIPLDVTIKFLKSDLKLKASKAALTAGSTFFREYFEDHPTRKSLTAPKTLQPGVNIKPEIVQTALAFMHGTAISNKNIMKNSIPLLLAAAAFGIASLEDRIRAQFAKNLSQQINRITSSVQILELVTALREMFGLLSGGAEVHREIAGVVTGAVASAFWKQIKVLNKLPEFMGFVEEVPGLAVEILKAGGREGGVDEQEASEESAKLGGGLEEETVANGHDVPEGEGVEMADG